MDTHTALRRHPAKWVAKSLFLLAAGGCSVWLFAMNDCAVAGDMYLFNGGLALIGICWALAAFCMIADGYVQFCSGADMATYVLSQVIFAAALCAFSGLYVYYTSTRELLYFALAVLLAGWVVLSAFGSGCCFHRGGRCPQWRRHQVPSVAEGFLATVQTLFVLAFLTLVVWLGVYDSELRNAPVAGCPQT